MKIFIIVIAVIVALVLELLLSRRGASGVTVNIISDTDTAEPDEEFHFTVKLTNASRALLPFVRYSVSLPSAMNITDASHVIFTPPATNRVTGSVVLWPRKSASQTITVSCPKRGHYRVGTIALDVGDFLGLKSSHTECSMFQSVSIFPKAAPEAECEETLGGIMGDHSVRRYIFEDPVLISGFREYTGREPMKAISWMQSARTGSLMVKKYDFTSDPSVSVVLNTDKSDGANVEKCFSIARTVCEMLEKNNVEYDFFMNADVGGSNSAQHYFAKGMGSRHFFGIMLQLARAEYSCSFSGADLIRRVTSSGENAPGIICIMPERNEANEELMDALGANPQVSLVTLYATDYEMGREMYGEGFSPDATL